MAASRGPAYRIRTPRLTLRCYQPEDAPLLKAAVDASLEHLRPWMPWAHHEPTDLATKVEFVRRCRGRFDLEVDYTYGLFDPAEDELLGGAGLHDRLGPDALEIGYWVRAGRTGQGYASELSAALTRVAFEVLGVERVEIRCDPANKASARVPEKIGFTHEATRRQISLDAAGERRDTMVWTMLRRELEGSPCGSQAVEVFGALGERLL